MKKINSLEGMRFFMIIGIVIAHFTFLEKYCYGKIFTNYFYNPLVTVDFFFILSGFGLAYTYKEEKAPKLKLPSLFLNALSRIHKIYYVYVISLVCCLPFFFWVAITSKGLLNGIMTVVAKFLVSLTLLQSVTGMKVFSHSINEVGWFLSTLFVLYIVSPILLKINNSIKERTKVVIIAFFTNIILYNITYIIFYNIQKKSIFDDLTYGSPYIRIFDFVSGILIADIYMMLRKSKLKKKGIRNLEYIVIFIAVIWFIFKNSIAPVYDTTLYSFFPKRAIAFLLASAIVFVFAFEQGPISKKINKGIFLLLGKVTMYIYLMHYPIVMLCNVVINETKFPALTNYPAVGILKILLNILLTGIATYFFYKRDKNRKDKLKIGCQH